MESAEPRLEVAAKRRIYPVTALLLLWGGVLVYFSLSDRLKHYLAPGFQPFVPVAGVVLILLALLYLFWSSTAKCDDEACSSCALVSGPMNGKFFIWIAVLCIPVLGALAGTRDAFTAVAIHNRGFLDSAALLGGARIGGGVSGEEPLPMDIFGPDIFGDDDFDPTAWMKRNEAGEIITEVVDLMYASEDDFLLKDFDGKRVEVSGQFLKARRRNPSGDRFQLMRLFMWCCASDARPVSVMVQDPGGHNFQEMDWVTIRGVARFPSEGGRRFSLIEADSIEPAEEPEERILY